jgi:hypothetical protein
MKKLPGLFVAIILTAPLSFVTGSITSFQGGENEHTLSLHNPTNTDSANIIIPASSIIMGASIDISSVLPDSSNPDCPRFAQVYLNDTLLWGFTGAGYGALGRQDTFLFDSYEKKFGFGEDGGNGNCSIRLMKDAMIKNATMEVNSNGAGGVDEMGSFQPQETSNYFGFSVACAGDVNRDGFDDVIIGEPENASKGRGSGMAHIFFGGPVINRTADIALTGESKQNYFGTSVSGAGDVNGDGYDDVIVGATQCDDCTPYNDVSRAYIFFGGAAMDSVPDVIIEGESNSSFGISVSGAGDVNGDGFDDIVVGANNTTAQNSIGRAFVYFGGLQMDNKSDVMLAGSGIADGFGHVVSGAGDVNNDSYDDVIVGAYTGIMRPGDLKAGAGAYLFLGGKSMDGAADVFFDGNAQSDIFGASVSGAGDVNGDGYGDIVIGAPGVDSKRGAAYVYCGGANIDNSPDFIFNGSNANDLFGSSVSDAGDVNGDGLSDVVVTAMGYSKPDWLDIGAAYMFRGGDDMQWNRDLFFVGPHQDDGYFLAGSSAGDVNGDGFDELFLGSPVNDVCPLFVHGGNGLDRPDITVGGKGIWTKTAFFDGTETTLPFPMVLQGYLASKSPTAKDGFGNVYTDVPVHLNAKGGGRMILEKLNVTYEYKSSITNFTGPLKEYVAAHRSEQDANGNITVPIKITSATPGRVKLLNLKIIQDEAPALKAPVPDLRIAEDTKNNALLDLSFYFKDDYDSLEALRFCATAVTNSSIVNVSIENGHFLSVDSLTSPLSENWTGEVKAVIECLDTVNLSRKSNEFTIQVYNVNDPPIIVSGPPPPGYTGEQYAFQVIAVDGDGDSISYILTKGPPGMTMNSTTGLINWISPVKGAFEMAVRVSDGQINSSRNYIITVENRPIWINNISVPEAQTGSRFTFRIPAVSDTGKELIYRQVGSVDGMAVDAYTGILAWTPAYAGDYPVFINISDGDYFMIYNFTIHVAKGNRAPRIVSSPVTSAWRGLNYSYQAKATDEDGDMLNFSLLSALPKMTINSKSGIIEWVPAAAGIFNASIKVSDGRGGEAVQNYTLHVGEYILASVEIFEPDKGQTVKGQITISGKVVKGTLEVQYIQIRIDSGDWMKAEGNSTWNFAVDTTKLTNGGHRIAVRAFDGNAYSADATRDITVNNQDMTYYLLLAVVAIAVIAVVAFVAMRRKGPGAEVPHDAAPEEPMPAEALPPEGGGQF